MSYSRGLLPSYDYQAPVYQGDYYPPQQHNYSADYNQSFAYLSNQTQQRQQYYYNHSARGRRNRGGRAPSYDNQDAAHGGTDADQSVPRTRGGRNQRRTRPTRGRTQEHSYVESVGPPLLEYGATGGTEYGATGGTDFGAVGGTALPKAKKQQRTYGYRKQINKKRISEAEEMKEVAKKKEEDKPKGAPPPARKNNRHGYKNKQRSAKGDDVDNDETQRGQLIEDLSSNSYECMVCCENVWRESAIWSCGVCFHVFHLRCIKKWARSANASDSKADNSGGWRCPSCQNVTAIFPSQYRCFCGKIRDPEYNYHDTPHSCGGVCQKPGPKTCSHRCTLVCHPGPCPPCHANVVQQCQCGRTKKTVRCGQTSLVQCEKVCEKALNCGKHQCKRVCHAGPCDPCEVLIHQDCFCEQESREVLCGSKDSFVLSFGCESVCNRTLKCGQHKCESICHPGECCTCDLLPEIVTTCPCGKTPLNEIGDTQRKSCVDPIPTCSAICDKELLCGPSGAPHRCKLPCHTGPCGACPGITEVTCRCGILNDRLPCTEVLTFTSERPFTCQRKCNKKLSCSRHKCQNRCCVLTEHKCEQICGQPCHNGKCPTCWHVSFDDLTCECGVESLIAPVACGTKPPECRQPCIRPHACDHQVMHNCHAEDRCPPCTVFTKKWCHGRHELREHIACHITELSCGRLCAKELPCKQHSCIKNCHKFDCLANGEKCAQPCQKPRDECGHACGAPCHPDDPCPPSSCRVMVEYRCECGNRIEKMPCNTHPKVNTADSTQFPSLATSFLAMKIASAQDGQSVDISSLKMKNAGKKLECNASCSILERNKQLALALQIRNPDLTGKLNSTQYNAFLKDYAKQHPGFVASVESAFHRLVESAQKSKHPHRSHAFAPMKSMQRRVIHELAEFYGCESLSYDEEPNKNVVATANKGRCWLPNKSLTTLIQSEMHPKAPMPMPHGVSSDQIRSAAVAANQSTKLIGPTKKRPPPPKQAWGVGSGVAPSASGKALAGPVVDYFDMTD
ncbi:hypothetical protein CAPTEDRAFT_154981 [Capitella teleta]|uniref:R3H domain-containing protein n=1 Tax=Capitella teleta TaxID=283909 RepID=R7TE85_CAPTE|nr:hypothetical protein CAPTEDRAFT_154981 [Capitella teleta]|eukprot:ELT89371.1 hypothetical protein CAPTEDRAFT_154981 [Capitella teleta]